MSDTEGQVCVVWGMDRAKSPALSRKEARDLIAQLRGRGIKDARIVTVEEGRALKRGGGAVSAPRHSLAKPLRSIKLSDEHWAKLASIALERGLGDGRGGRTHAIEWLVDHYRPKRAR